MVTCFFICATCNSCMCLGRPGARFCTGYTCSRALLAARSRLCSHASAAGENQQDYVQPTPVQRLRRRLRPMHTSNWPRHCCRSGNLDCNMRQAVLLEPLQFCRVQGCSTADWSPCTSAERSLGADCAGMWTWMSSATSCISGPPQ